jgi:cytochrome P450
MRFLASVKQRLATRMLERTMSNGLDLRKLRFFPQSWRVPFKRNGLDPVPELTRLRETEPVSQLGDLLGRGIWLVTGYDEARAVLAAGTDFSNDLGQFVPQEGRDDKDQVGGLGMTDPPNHTTLRRYLTPEFTKKRLARLEPLIEGIVAERLDAMEAAGPQADLVRDFAFPVPFEVICELLGLPVDDRARFHSLGVARFDLSTGSSGSFDAAGHSRDFLISSVTKQREAPGPGLIGALLTDHGDELDDVTLGGLADGVFLGGYETSASMLSLGAYLLAGNPEAMALIREDDETVDRVIEELLRYLTVVQLAFVRFARRDLELGGKQIHAGDAVGVSLLTANRDPALGPDLETFDPHREPTRHLAFGHGLHRCVGSELARMELRIALRALATRFPDLHVTADVSELDFRKLSAVYGVEGLPVSLYAPEAQTA